MHAVFVAIASQARAKICAIKCGWVYEDNGIYYYMSVGFIVTKLQVEKEFSIINDLVLLLLRCVREYFFFCFIYGVGTEHTSIEGIAFMSRCIQIVQFISRHLSFWLDCRFFSLSMSIHVIPFFSSFSLWRFFQKVFHWMLMKMNLGKWIHFNNEPFLMIFFLSQSFELYACGSKSAHRMEMHNPNTQKNYTFHLNLVRSCFFFA